MLLGMYMCPARFMVAWSRANRLVYRYRDKYKKQYIKVHKRGFACDSCKLNWLHHQPRHPDYLGRIRSRTPGIMVAAYPIYSKATILRLRCHPCADSDHPLASSPRTQFKGVPFPGGTIAASATLHNLTSPLAQVWIYPALHPDSKDI